MISNAFFPEIKGNFGFGCMRLPVKDGEIDLEEFSKMADAFIGAGFNYFDTAHGYHDGRSETAVRDCVARRRRRSEFRQLDLVPCTGCSYCIRDNDCPQKIAIPELFSAFNSYSAFHNWNTKFYYKTVLTDGDRGKASDCIKCGKCERVCPQHLPIRELLEKVSAAFEKH